MRGEERGGLTPPGSRVVGARMRWPLADASLRSELALLAVGEVRAVSLLPAQDAFRFGQGSLFQLRAIRQAEIVKTGFAYSTHPDQANGTAGPDPTVQFLDAVRKKIKP